MLPAAGEKQARERETTVAQTKKMRKAPSRPVHAVLGVGNMMQRMYINASESAAYLYNTMAVTALIE